MMICHCTAKSAEQMMAKVMSSRWPANMLANSRTHRDSGLVMSSVISSMNTSKRQDRLRDTRRDERRLEVAAEPLPLDADDVVHDVHEQRHEQRQRDARVHRHLRDRDDLPDVADEDEAEHHQQEGRVEQPVLAHRLHDDAVADEVDRRLGDVLHADRDEALTLRTAIMKNANTTMTDAHISRTTLLTPSHSPPKMIGHSTAWLIGGNSRARIDGITRLSAEA